MQPFTDNPPITPPPMATIAIGTPDHLIPTMKQLLDRVMNLYTHIKPSVIYFLDTPNNGAIWNYARKKSLFTHGIDTPSSPPTPKFFNAYVIVANDPATLTPRQQRLINQAVTYNRPARIVDHLGQVLTTIDPQSNNPMSTSL